MSQIRSNPFRLVGNAAAADHKPSDSGHLTIASENISASQVNIQLNDPRWTLATIAYAKLKEGPLSPESRDELIRKATRSGLRAFDASLIIAIAQDQARDGRGLEHAESTLRLIRPPHQEATPHHAVRRWSMAVVCATLLSTALLMLLGT